MSYVDNSRPGEALFKDIRLDADTNPHHDWPHPPSSLWPLCFCRCQVLFLVLVLAQAFICLHLSGLARPPLLFSPPEMGQTNHPLHVSWPLPINIRCCAKYFHPRDPNLVTGSFAQCFLDNYHVQNCDNDQTSRRRAPSVHRDRLETPYYD